MRGRNERDSFGDDKDCQRTHYRSTGVYTSVELNLRFGAAFGTNPVGNQKLSRALLKEFTDRLSVCDCYLRQSSTPRARNVQLSNNIKNEHANLYYGDGQDKWNTKQHMSAND